MTNRIKTISIVITLAAVGTASFLYWKNSEKRNVDGIQAPISSNSAVESTESEAVSEDGSKVSVSSQANNSLNPRGESASNATSPDSPAAPAPGTVVPEGVAPAQPVAASGCFEMNFHHRKLPTHADAESCQRHKNRLKLAHPLKELKALCVRIDGDAVPYEKIAKIDDEILVAPLAGPNSMIKVSYCMGSAKCGDFKESCKIKPRKDAFLEAVGGVAEEKDNGQVAGWDAEGASEADKKAVREVASEIQALEGDLKAEKDEDNVEFSGWTSDAESASSACEIRKQAQKDSPQG